MARPRPSTIAFRTAALPALLMLAAADAPPPTAAPSIPAAPAPAAAPGPAAREMLESGTAQRLIGRDVAGPGGDTVGRIVDVLLGDDGQPRAAVLDYGGFLGVGRRRVAVAWRTLRFSAGAVRLELSRDQMRAFPDYREGEPVVAAAPPATADAAPAETSAPDSPPRD